MSTRRPPTNRTNDASTSSTKRTNKVKKSTIKDPLKDKTPPASPPPHEKGTVMHVQHVDESQIIKINVATSNQYEPLSDDESVISQTLINNQKPQTQHKSPRPPPIFVYTEKTKETMQIISNSCKHKYNVRLNIDHINVQSTDIDDYVLITNSLKARNIEFFSYNFKKDRPVKILLKYIPKDYDIEDVEESLREQGFPFTKATFLTKIESGQKKRYRWYYYTFRKRRHINTIPN